MSFSQFLLILRARWKITVATLVIISALVIGVSMILPKQYTATSAVILDFKPDPVSIAFNGGAMSPAYLATQIDIINSTRVGRKVVRSLKLTENPDTRQSWVDATGGIGDFEGWLVDSLQRSLDVRPSRESNVISVSFTGADPRFATILANAFVRAYIDTTLDLRVDPAKQYSSFFEDRSKQLREDLEAAQTRLSQFQRDKGIVGADERIDIETARLNELASQVVGAQGAIADSSSRQALARTSADQMQEVLNNPVISGLKADLNRTQAQYQQLSARYGEAHPQLAELRASMAELRARIDAETRRVTSGVSVTNSINRGREAEIRAALDAQRAKVLKLKSTRDDLQVLQRDVENAQRAYDGVLARLNQTSMESQTTQTNVSVLTPAVEPSKPSSPRVILNGVLGIFFGLLLGIAFALLAEFRNRKVRSPADILEGLGLPMLGVMLPPDAKPKFGRRAQQPLLMQRVLGQLPAPQTKGA